MERNILMQQKVFKAFNHGDMHVCPSIAACHGFNAIYGDISGKIH